MTTLTVLAQNILLAINLIRKDIVNLQDAISADDDNKYNIIDGAMVRSLTPSQLEEITKLAKDYFVEYYEFHGCSCVLEYFAASHDYQDVLYCLKEINEEVDLNDQYEGDLPQDVGKGIFSKITRELSMSNERFYLITTSHQIGLLSIEVKTLIYSDVELNTKDLGVCAAATLAQGGYVNHKGSGCFKGNNGVLVMPIDINEITMTTYFIAKDIVKLHTLPADELVSPGDINVKKYLNALDDFK